jgi:hypothetical protein
MNTWMLMTILTTTRLINLIDVQSKRIYVYNLSI